MNLWNMPKRKAFELEPLNVFPLSEIIGGNSPPEMNHHRHSRGVSVDRSGPSSRCTIRGDARVNIAMNALKTLLLLEYIFLK